MTTPSRYPIPAGEHRHELVERRSRFLCVLAPITDEEGAAALLAALREEHPGANHHCWAFVVGPPGSTARVGSSDAGEPSGTAGRPMLEALVHGPVGDVAAVVVRWFGGVKLGTGGLARAYAGVVRDALETLPTIQRTEWVSLRVSTGYAEAEALRRTYGAHEAELLDERFDAGVTHGLRVPADCFGALVEAITGATHGAAVVERISPPGSD
jgi:uncharacterized YigZ family protein